MTYLQPLCSLTVAEHLWFYSRMKGMANAEVKHEMKQMIKEIGLPHKTDALAKTLSGKLNSNGISCQYSVQVQGWMLFDVMP